MGEYNLGETIRLNHEKRRKEALDKKKSMIARIDNELNMLNHRSRQLSAEESEAVHAYWDKYTEGDAEGWVAYYSGIYGEFDVRFLPDSVYYIDIDPYLNHREAAGIIDHKAYYSRLFPDVPQPGMLACRINDTWLNQEYDNISENDVAESCSRAGKVIVKPAAGYCGGLGISVWDSQKNSEEELRRILDRTKTDMVIQEYLKQSPVTASLHSSSVNTIRTISFYHKGDIKILSSIIRIGVGESQVDNISAGGISVGICEDGSLKEKGFDKKGNSYRVHPDGAVFEGVKINAYGQICSHIKRLHRALPYFRLISWDFAVDEKETPVLIEANLMNGELDFHQMNNGPLFKKMTQEVLNEVYERRIARC